MKFNPGIEGLRGVAILMVVLAHAGVPGMAAGFVGVDIFFVISGFLITGLLTEELQKTGQVDLWNFYARRARRLAPALLVMVLVVSVAVVVLVPESARNLHLSSGFWSLLWASNFYFTFAGFDYFDPSATESLFLHTWSLGVEEQFYLVWPLLLAWAWPRKGQGWSWLLVLTGLGFFVGLGLLWVDANAAYYLMPSRLWQLAMGGVVWRLWHSRPRWLDKQNKPVGWAGVALLAAGIWHIDGGQAYPGWPSLFPTLGSACLVLSVAYGSSNLPALRAPPLLLAGRISYSWYLWHWPVLFMPLAMGWTVVSPSLRLALVLGSFLLALLSYLLVEQPLRKTRGSPEATVVFAVVASIVLASALHIAPASIAPPLLSDKSLLEARISGDIAVPDIYFRADCDQWYHSDELVPCEYAPAGHDVPVVVFLGDSVGGQWLPAIEKLVELKSLKLIVLTKSSCPIVDEPFHYDRINRRFTECETWRDAALAYIRESGPEWVIMGSTQYDFSAAQWREGSRRVLESIVAGGSKAIVLAPTPILDVHVPQCLVARARLEGDQLISEDCRKPIVEVDPLETIGHLRDAASAVPGSAVLYLNDIVCSDGMCGGVVSGRITYRDSQHLNAAYVEDLADVFLVRFEDSLRQAAGHRMRTTPPSKAP